jgi:uncharacterized protein YggT (Ycf19 family)
MGATKAVLALGLVLCVGQAAAGLVPAGHSLGMTPLPRADGRMSGRTSLHRRPVLAAAMPGDSLVEEVFVDGFRNFINIYQNLLVGSVLLSWFPQSRSYPFLQPLFNVCDPYLNTFRGILPSLGGIDFSPILAFTLLNALGGAMVSLGAETPAAKSFAPPRQVGFCETLVDRHFASQLAAFRR